MRFESPEPAADALSQSGGDERAQPCEKRDVERDHSHHGRHANEAENEGLVAIATPLMGL